MKKIQYLLLSLCLLIFACEEETPSYQITTSVSEGGTINFDNGSYEEGVVITMEAVPSEHYQFIRWTGTISSEENPLIFNVSKEELITANFEKISYAFTTNIEGQGSIKEELISSAKTTDYDSGDVLKLTAEPDEGWEFEKWTGDIESTESQIQIEVTDAQNITAVFKILEFSLTVSANGSGSVEISPEKDIYQYGDEVTLTANPEEGYGLKNWSGDLEEDTNPLTFIIESNLNITANFESPVYIDENGITVKAKDWATVGDFGVINNELYEIVDNSSIRAVATPDLSKIVTTFMTDMRELFKESKRTRFNIENWDVSNVTNMEGMFSSADDFNQDIGNWDVSNVTNMANMFRSTNDFNQNIGDWDVSNVTNMKGMFYDAISFNNDIGDWDVSNVIDMSEMFAYAIIFNKDIRDWNTSQVTNMEKMFNFARNFNQYIGNWNTQNVTNMSSMFRVAFEFNQDIGQWDTQNVTNMNNMFYNSKSFNGDINNWDVSNVTDMNNMFYYSESFNRDIGNWDVSNVTDMSGMFTGTSEFNQDIGNWDVSNVIDMTAMFSTTPKFNQNIGQWNTENVQNMTSMFGGAASFNQNISGWDVSSVTNMQTMFADALKFNQDLSGWDVIRVSNYGGFDSMTPSWTLPKPNFQ